MKSSVVIVLLVLSLAANGFLWWRVSELERAVTPAADKDYPLGENMGYMQRYAEKLWYAAQAGNWDLARYYHDEMQETAEDIHDAKVVKEGVDVSTTLGTMLPPVLKGVDEAISARDPTLFGRRYEKLVETCSACHVAAKHPFIRIVAPTGSPTQWNQDFAPAPAK